MTEIAYRPGDPVIGVGPLVFGVILVAGIIIARVLYNRRKAKEPPVPPGHHPREGAWETRDEHGRHPPDHGPGHQDGPVPEVYENATRDPEVVEPGPRRYPEELRDYPGPRT